jgi:hypothetical protein
MKALMMQSLPPRPQVARTLLPTAKMLLSEQAVDAPQMKPGKIQGLRQVEIRNETTTKDR